MDNRLLTDEEIRGLLVAHYTELWDEETAKEVTEKVTLVFSHKVAQAQLAKDKEWEAKEIEEINYGRKVADS